MALPTPSRKHDPDRKPFPKHSPGLCPMVLADVIYLGYRPGEWKGKPKASEKVALVFQSQKFRDDGKRYELSTELTYSDFENSNLVKFLSPWIGPFANDGERSAAVTGLDSRIGTSGLVTVQHKPSRKGDGTIFAEIVSVAPLMDGMTPLKVEGYERAKFWAEKIAKYADEYVKFQADRAAEKAREAANGETFPAAAGGLDEFPAALAGDDDEDSIPF